MSMALPEVRENPTRLIVGLPLDFLADALPWFSAGWGLLSHRTVLKHEHHLLKTLNSKDSSKWPNSSKYLDKASFTGHTLGKVAPIRPCSLLLMRSAGGPKMYQALCSCEQQQTWTCPPISYKSLPPTHQAV